MNCYPKPDIAKNPDTEAWYNMHKFNPAPRQMEEFQPCCTQFETDPNISLSFIPLCIIRCEDGRIVKKITGTKFTTITFGENNDPDLETCITDMDDEQLNSILIKIFGITLKSPISFHSIMEKNNR